MKVIILAAGRGERLMPLSQNTPKSLIESRDGVTVLESQLRCIHAAGITEVVIVGGYRVEQIEAKVLMYQQELSMRIRVTYNPFFNTSNNLISLWLARHEMDGDFVILNGDDVFDSDVLPGLLTQDASRDICMVIDRKDAYTGEDMKVHIRGDRVYRIGKTLAPDDANGESIGMIRVVGTGRKLLVEKLDHMVRKEESKRIFYLQAFNELMESGWPVFFHEIRPDQWSEIDFHPDLDLVRNQIRLHAKPVLNQKSGDS
jgi:choline kinase